MPKKIKISPVHLQYWCRTSVIDEIVCKRKNIAFDRQLAQDMERESRHYFVLDKKGNYDILPGLDFEAYFNDKDIELKDRVSAPEREMTPEATTAINAFIKSVHKI